MKNGVGPFKQLAAQRPDLLVRRGCTESRKVEPIVTFKHRIMRNCFSFFVLVILGLIRQIG